MMLKAVPAPTYSRHAILLAFGPEAVEAVCGDDLTVSLTYIQEQFREGVLKMDQVLTLSYYSDQAQIGSARDIPNVRIVDATGQAHFYCLRYSEPLRERYKLSYTSSLIGHLLLYPVVDAIVDDLAERDVNIEWMLSQNELDESVRLALKQMQVRDRMEYSVDKDRLDFILPNGVRIRSNRNPRSNPPTSRHFLLAFGDKPFTLARIDTPIRLEHEISPDSVAWDELEMDIEDAFADRGLITTVSIESDPEAIKDFIRSAHDEE